MAVDNFQSYLSSHEEIKKRMKQVIKSFSMRKLVAYRIRRQKGRKQGYNKKSSIIHTGTNKMGEI